MRWGFYYYPKGCIGEKVHCPLQLVIHGCNLNTERSMVPYFAPFASANNVVMVFPQALECWDNTGLTRQGPAVYFMEKIIETVSKP
jgi:hypothetical protein